jgi:hypothetical protein
MFFNYKEHQDARSAKHKTVFAIDPSLVNRLMPMAIIMLHCSRKTEK